MRISSSYKYDTYQYNLQHAEQRLVEISQQLSTGKRINQPSDDPVGTWQSITLQSLKDGIQQYMGNLNTAKGSLGFVDNTASSLNDLMNQAYQIAVQGASSTTDQTGRNAMASQITSLQTELIGLANTQGTNGAYIFAGQKTDTKPYTLTGSVLTFNGDTNPINVESGPGQTIQVSAAGEPMITTMYNTLQTLKNDLTSGQVGAISGVDIANVQASLATVSSLRGDVGARMQTVANLTTQYQVHSDNLTKSISDLEDVDMASAAVQYQQASQAYTAALTVVGQGSSLSLLDYIK